MVKILVSPDPTPRRSDFYSQYLQTAAWKARRAAALIRAGHKCQECGADDRLEVHHLTYRRLGHERPSDLRVLCVTCHQAADALREAATLRRRQEAHNRRVIAWADVHLGPGWRGEYPWGVAEEEYRRAVGARPRGQGARVRSRRPRA